MLDIVLWEYLFPTGILSNLFKKIVEKKERTGLYIESLVVPESRTLQVFNMDDNVGLFLACFYCVKTGDPSLLSLYPSSSQYGDAIMKKMRENTTSTLNTIHLVLYRYIQQDLVTRCHQAFGVLDPLVICLLGHYDPGWRMAFIHTLPIGPPYLEMSNIVQNSVDLFCFSLIKVHPSTKFFPRFQQETGIDNILYSVSFLYRNSLSAFIALGLYPTQQQYRAILNLGKRGASPNPSNLLL